MHEVEEITAQADKAGLTLCSIYIGGGTPTSLSADQLRQLMGTVRQNFDLSQVMEYTVEAGRPDCTDAEKLAVIKEYGATRISINPQTFSDEVLAGIGRKHSAQDILDCYAEARKAGHDDINMDLIAGLPADTVESFEHSLRQAIALDPENITVHTLTLKRASRIVIEDQKETTTPTWPPCWKSVICWPRRATALLPLPPEEHPAESGKRGLVQAGPRGILQHLHHGGSSDHPFRRCGR